MFVPGTGAGLPGAGAGDCQGKGLKPRGGPSAVPGLLHPRVATAGTAASTPQRRPPRRHPDAVGDPMWTGRAGTHPGPCVGRMCVRFMYTDRTRAPHLIKAPVANHMHTPTLPGHMLAVWTADTHADRGLCRHPQSPVRCDRVWAWVRWARGRLHLHCLGASCCTSGEIPPPPKAPRAVGW